MGLSRKFKRTLLALNDSSNLPMSAVNDRDFAISGLHDLDNLVTYLSREHNFQGNFLDLGSGSGLVAYVMADQGLNAYGIEINSDLVEYSNLVRIQVQVVSRYVGSSNPTFINGNFRNYSDNLISQINIWYVNLPNKYFDDAMKLFSQKAKSGSILISCGLANNPYFAFHEPVQNYSNFYGVDLIDFQRPYYVFRKT